MNRDDFPILQNQPELVYLDSANTALKPQVVIDAVNNYYTNYSANISRTSYQISERATAKFNESREIVAKFLGARADEIIFTYSTTYGINQIAQGIKSRLKTGDIILLTLNEHNSNLLVWQEIAKETGAKIAFVEEISETEIAKIKIFSYSLVSNMTGEVFDYSELTQKIHAVGGLIAIDASQAVPHLETSVKKLGCDFLVFSSHKIYGPSGVGVLYIRRDLQSTIQPLVYGSQTFDKISKTDFKLVVGPAAFEPGTPNIEGVIGLGAAIKYLQKIDMKKITAHDHEIIDDYYQIIDTLKLGDFVFRKTANQIGVCSLTHPRVHPHDIAMLLDGQNIAVRAGKACADLVADRYDKRQGVLRASFGLYTTKSDIEKYLRAYKNAIEELNG